VGRRHPSRNGHRLVRTVSFQDVQERHDGDWLVHTVSGGAAVKIYRCPGCNQEIRPGVPHIVAWPYDGRGDVNDRRHWHTPCWKTRVPHRSNRKNV
jgi:hypothetical protein